MSSEENKKGVDAPEAGAPSTEEPDTAASGDVRSSEGDGHAVETEYTTGQTVSYTPTTDSSYGYYDDPYAYNPDHQPAAQAGDPQLPAPPPPPPPADTKPDEEDEDEEGMLRMSFLEHLEELRTRLIRVVAGLGVAFVLSLTFAERLWMVVQQPAGAALKQLGFSPNLVQNTPMESFTIVWMKLPLLTAIFIASPWVLYQVWGFISPGLYKKERRLAVPFILCSAGLFIMGGLFAYFVAFRFGLTFLLGIGKDIGIVPLITITDYFDLFFNVIMGIGLVFELPILIFFLTLLRIASPRFLIANSRYAILLIVLLAALITPTPDVFNLVIFSVPMVLLYFVGIFASYLLVLSRENRRFPWKTFALVVIIPLILVAAGVCVASMKYGYQIVPTWPFFVR